MRTLPIALLATLAAAPVAAQDHDHHAHGHAPAAAALPLRELEAARRATERYRDHANAVADGYRRFGEEGPLMGEHWYHPDRTRDAAWDPARPSTLQYATIGGRKVLVGVAYTVYRRPGEPVPEGFSGEADVWHTHDLRRIVDAFGEGRPLLRWLAGRRLDGRDAGGRTLLTMVHAWLWEENPDGPFGHEHRALPYLRAGLPAAWAGDRDAAMGVALLQAGRCESEVRQTDRLAGMSAGQARAFRDACESAALAVREARDRGVGREALNGTAAVAWRSVENARDRILDREQDRRYARRLAAITEHGMAVH